MFDDGDKVVVVRANEVPNTGAKTEVSVCRSRVVCVEGRCRVCRV